MNNLKVTSKPLLTLTLALLMVVTIMGSASAVPPFATVQEFNTGLILVTSPQQYLKQNEDFTVNFWVHNISNGAHIDNTTVSCSFYLANATGDLIVEGVVEYNVNEYWDFLILGANFSEVGEYNWGIDCHGINLGGATTGAYLVNSVGQELTESQSLLSIGLMLILILFMGVIFFGIGLLPARNTKDEEGRILSISYLKYLRSTLWFVEWMLVIAVLFIASNLAIAYLIDGLLADVFFTLFHMCFALTPLIVIVWMIWIFVSMFHDKQFQRLLNRGMFPGKGI